MTKKVRIDVKTNTKVHTRTHNFNQWDLLVNMKRRPCGSTSTLPLSSRTQPTTAVESERLKYQRPHDLFIQVIQIKRASMEHVLSILNFEGHREVAAHRLAQKRRINGTFTISEVRTFEQ